ncbi:cache domain-containing protein [Oceanicoccus sagamiensis]|uniref:Cache domain-containing protein n=1 Tax=Oceanicoccus sagamiensis TaxID=716816 RepID=A0A1X9NBV1_9GAMM|nr:cache domain-containing protein [Oceanicoccus sagamiensis]ARN74651.1 hypothetical protein BST96_11265 [Oceanicoccus sagamiensis]
MSNKTNRFWLLPTLGLLLVVLVLGYAINRTIINTTIEHNAERFQLLNQLRRNALVEYFETTKAEIVFWSLNPQLLSHQQTLVNRWAIYADQIGYASTQLRKFYISNNPFPLGERHQLSDAGDGSIYSEVHADIHPMAKMFVTERGYYDLFLINNTGDIFYSVQKEDDFGTNLVSGQYKDSGLAHVFKRAINNPGTVAFSDLEHYQPSNGDPAMFMATSLSNEKGEVLGVLALQLPTAKIENIMNFDGGMGESGETYLVGKDQLMRSQSRFSTERTSLKVKVDTTTTRRALAGEKGVEFTDDYRGIRVLSAFDSVTFDTVNWAVMAEIDEAEIIDNVAQARPAIAALISLLYALSLWSVWLFKDEDLGSDTGSFNFDTDSSDFSTTD